MLSCNNLDTYTLTKNNILLFSSNLEKSNLKKQTLHFSYIPSIIKEPKAENILKEDLFTPSHEDKLFWCFYIIYFGQSEYEKMAITGQEFKIEKNFKIDSIKLLREKKDKLKKNKIRINEIEDEFLNQSKISLKGLLALCLIYDKNIMYIWDNKFIEMVHSDDNIHVIYLKEKQNSLSLNTTAFQLEWYKNNYWKIENVTKPLKGITTYNLSQLKDISKRLNIELLTETKKPKTKQQLYMEILGKL
jgi:hypothetical protein